MNGTVEYGVGEEGEDMGWENGTLSLDDENATAIPSEYFITPPSDPMLARCINIVLRSDIQVRIELHEDWDSKRDSFACSIYFLYTKFIITINEASHVSLAWASPEARRIFLLSHEEEPAGVKSGFILLFFFGAVARVCN